MELVESDPRATLFHHPVWLEVMRRCYGFRPFVLATLDAHGQVTAGLPFAAIRSPLTGARWVSLPYTDYCNPLYRDDASLEQLTDSLVALADEKHTPRLSVRWSLPERPAITAYSHFVWHHLPLDGDTVQQGKRLDKMHRQNIRAARRNGVQIEQGTDFEQIEQFYQLQLVTRHRKGLPAQPWRFFRLLKELIFDQGLGFVMLAHRENELLSGAIFLHWGQVLMAKYAASYEEALHFRPNNLLFWTGIGWGCTNGYQTFCFGRSERENTGLRDFKSRWGATELPLTYSAVAAAPPEQRTGRLMQTLNSVILHSPVWMSRVTGELLYGHFE